MATFDGWTLKSTLTPVAAHKMGTISSCDDSAGATLVGASLPHAYADTTALAMIAEKYGKFGVAEFLRTRMPTKTSARSGDMGEILAAAYLAEEWDYTVGPSRLIDRDHQEWAMRGDDVIAARINENLELHIIKAEAKSRVALGQATVGEARAGLARNDEMPSPHSLSQFATRLLNTADRRTGEALLDLQLNSGVRPERVGHLMFLLTGSDPRDHVSADLRSYNGSVPQLTITVRFQNHQKFIRDAYDEVTADAP